MKKMSIIKLKFLGIYLKIVVFQINIILYNITIIIVSITLILQSSSFKNMLTKYGRAWDILNQSNPVTQKSYQVVKNIRNIQEHFQVNPNSRDTKSEDLLGILKRPNARDDEKNGK